MPLVEIRRMYQEARQAGYAIGGFNVEHLYMAKAVIEAAEEARSPAIIFIWEKDLQMAGAGVLEGIVRHYVERTTVPLAIMLDHGTSLENCRLAIESGHQGVMIDASHKPLAENISLTQTVAKLAQPLGIFVEGEIGTVNRTFENTGEFSEPAKYTDPNEAVEFAAKSGVDAMAISIGSASGMPKETPQLDIQRLQAIRSQTEAFLVLHGGSGTPPDQIQTAVKNGISGIRFATCNRLVFFDAVAAKRKALGYDNPDSRLILQAGAAAVKKQTQQLMIQLGSAGQA